MNITAIGIDNIEVPANARFNIGHSAYATDGANAFVPDVDTLEALNVLIERGVLYREAICVLHHAHQGNHATCWNLSGSVIEVIVRR